MALNRTVKKYTAVFILLLAACLMVLSFSVPVLGIPAEAEEPEIISTAEDLAALADRVNAGDKCEGITFILENDIDLSELTDRESWTPIGIKNSLSFGGTFDGNGHIISHLHITSGKEENIGLFGYIASGGCVKNLTLTDVDIDISSSSRVGGVAGFINSSASVLSCTVLSGSVKGNKLTGGVVGRLYGRVEGCCAAVSVTGSGEKTGGICGEAVNGASITQCYYTGMVSGTSYVGGICGYLFNNIPNPGDIMISSCYAAGTVSGKKNVGGIAGKCDEKGRINQSIALQKSISADNTCGRVVGDILSQSFVFNSFAWEGIQLPSSGSNEEEETVAEDDVWNNLDFFTEHRFSPSVWKIETGLPTYKLPVFTRQTAEELAALDADYLHPRHTEVTDEAVEPTCTETGLTEGSHCSVCGTVIIAQEVIPANGHTEVTDEGIDPTCTEPGLSEGSHCSVCDAVIIAQEVIPAKGHTEVTDEGIDPTCTESGLSEGSHCSVCAAVIKAQQVIPAKGHTEVTDEAVEPTCTKPGHTEGSHCSVCDTVIIAPQVIPAKGHTEVTDKAVEPTCTKPGHTEGSHCSVCAAVITAPQVIPAKGHTEVTDEAVEPTCTETGLSEGIHCSVCGTVIKAQQVIPAKGHTEVTDKAVEPTCTEPGLSEGSHCSVCSTVIKAQQVIPAKGHIEVIDKRVEPTYSHEGLTEGSHCSVCGKILIPQQIIPRLKHTPVQEVSILLPYEMPEDTEDDAGEQQAKYPTPAVSPVIPAEHTTTPLSAAGLIAGLAAAALLLRKRE